MCTLSIHSSLCCACVEKAEAAVTDEGLFVLTRAIKAAGQRGLPMLSTLLASGLQQVTGVGVGALVPALIDNCPRLSLVDLSGRTEEAGLQAAADGMVRGAECGHRLTVYF